MLNTVKEKYAAVFMNQGKIGSGQKGEGKSECQHFRIQRTKMDWNG